MRFKLSTTCHTYDDREQIQKLKGFGFLFQPSRQHVEEYEISGEPEMEITTMDDLITFLRACEELIILDVDPLSIEIYDGHRE